LVTDKAFLSVIEFSFLLSLSPRTIAKLIASGELQSVRIGRRRLIPSSELDRFAKKDRKNVRLVHRKTVSQ
jgi:excisionase family DNA binding protein